MSRLIWYVIFSLVIVGVLIQVGVPEVITGAYVLIAVVGFVMAARDLRAAQEEFRREIMAAGERLLARMETQQAAARTQPWYAEVVAAQNAAELRGASMFGIFSTFNPYWSLSLDSLVRHGLTTEREIELITSIARTSPPESWQNGFILSDLESAGYTREQALVRIGLFFAHEDSFGQGEDS